MPFDGQNFTKTAERIATRDEFWAATPRERLAMLAFALRHVPITHAWDFTRVGGGGDCGSAGCALGLANVLWGDEGERRFAGDAAVESVSHDEVHGLLGINDELGERFYGCPRTYVTPAMVADAIDQYLASA